MRCVLLILASVIPASAPTDVDATWKQGLDLFDRGKASLGRHEDAKAWFMQSAAKFADLQRNGIRHPSLYRNLGNALYMSDRLPEAILAYRQGLLLDPGDESIRDALAIARAQVVRVDESHGVAERETWPAWLPWPGFETLLGACWAAWMAACIMASIGWRRKRLKIVFAAACLIAMAVGCGMTWKSRVDLAFADNLVVVREDAIALRRGNGLHYPAHPDLPVLRRGMEARSLHERGGWMQIRFASGEVGWVPSEAVVASRVLSDVPRVK
ncbi:MAG: tetratricopeptide repeat protein [Gemmataceae bacterium]